MDEIGAERLVQAKKIALASDVMLKARLKTLPKHRRAWNVHLQRRLKHLSSATQETQTELERATLWFAFVVSTMLRFQRAMTAMQTAFEGHPGKQLSRFLQKMLVGKLQ